jgi:malonyl-CoA decarboxylase
VNNRADARPAPGTLMNLRRKTVVGLLRTWRELKGTARLAITGEVRPSLPKEDIEHLRKRMQQCLHTKGGEITARVQTMDLGKTYLSLTDGGRAKFLQVLAEDFDIDRGRLTKIIEAIRHAKEGAEVIRLENDLREALVTPRSTILRHFNTLPDGFKFLVDMRADLLPLIGKEAALKGLEYDLKAILSSWFDIGLLDLVEITWNSPAAVLEKLIEYEAVHKVRSWEDMKNRLDADRRVYAFFHNKMPHEPLIFVHVALIRGMADNVQALLDEASPVVDPDEADTALFYSISNAQKGLTGISFGNFLIKRVVDKLSRELRLKHFATLSPVPGLRSWLDPHLAKGDESLLQEREKKEIHALVKTDNAAKGLQQLLDGEWYKDAKVVARLGPVLERICARYLLKEKKKLVALDPVAHFHLTNGARLERINMLGDISAKGLKQSAGIMVNYYYDLDAIDDNHEDYVTEGKIAASRQVRGLV